MMDWQNLDPDEVARAKERAAGPAGEMTAKFPLRFASPIVFGPEPKPGVTVDVRNGTLGLFRMEGRLVGVTCSHVLACYRKRLSKDTSVTFQVGNLRFDPLPRLTAEDETHDFAVLDLDGLDVTRFSIAENVGTDFHHPVRWPSTPVVPGQFVVTAGYPGVWRHDLPTAK